MLTGRRGDYILVLEYHEISSVPYTPNDTPNDKQGPWKIWRTPPKFRYIINGWIPVIHEKVWRLFYQ